MAGPAKTPTKTLWTRVQADLARDPKKTGLMLVLTVVAGVLGARMLGQRSTPVPAAAALAIESPPRLAGKAGAARADRAAPLKGTEQERRENYLARMDRGINRDLFKTNPEYFPAAGGTAEEDSAANSAGRGGWLGDMAEQLVQQQQAQRDRLERMAAIRAQAQTLNLQSTLLGSTPTALINGQPLHAGEAINGFVITEITPNACRLTREGVPVELRMKK